VRRASIWAASANVQAAVGGACGRAQGAGRQRGLAGHPTRLLHGVLRLHLHLLHLQLLPLKLLLRRLQVKCVHLPRPARLPARQRLRVRLRHQLRLLRLRLRKRLPLCEVGGL